MYWPASGMNSILDYLRLGQGAIGLKWLQTREIGLLAAAPTIAFGMGLGAITECSFPGYARANTVGWTSGASFADPFVVNDAPAVSFTNTGLLPTVIYGAFIRDTFDLIAVDVFASPITLGPGLTFTYTPEIRIKSLSP